MWLRADIRPGAATASALLMCAASLQAQTIGAHVDVGVARMRYTDTVSVATTSITPSLRVVWRRATLDVDGGLSAMQSQWTSQGSAVLSSFVPVGRLLTGELAATGAGSAHQDGSRTGQFMATPRLHLARTSRGAWIGAGAGTMWDQIAWRTVREAEIGAWAVLGRLTATGSVSPTAVADTIRYTDAVLGGSVATSKSDISGTMGIRRGDRFAIGGSTGSAWLSGAIAWWLRPDLAVVGGAGSYPIDPAQGYPGGRFVSLAVRLGNRRGQPSATTAHAESHPAPASDDAADVRPAIEIRSAGEVSTRIVRIRAGEARRVQVSGDFTNWDPVELRRSTGGWWEVRVPLMAGKHEIVVRRDGGDWLVPAGLMVVKDELGVTSGLLIVR